jgi:hypothetical protein
MKDLTPGSTPSTASHQTPKKNASVKDLTPGY